MLCAHMLTCTRKEALINAVIEQVKCHGNVNLRVGNDHCHDHGPVAKIAQLECACLQVECA